MTTSTVLTMGPPALVALVVIVVLATAGVSVLRRLRRNHDVPARPVRRLRLAAAVRSGAAAEPETMARYDFRIRTAPRLFDQDA